MPSVGAVSGPPLTFAVLWAAASAVGLVGWALLVPEPGAIVYYLGQHLTPWTVPVFAVVNGIEEEVGFRGVHP